VRPEAAPEAAAQDAGADGKNSAVKAYHPNIIPTESVSTGKENLKIIAYPTNVPNLVNNFSFLLSNVLMQIYSPHRGKT
jgi:hypothetical protein